MEKRKVKCSGYGMFTGIFGIVALGIVFGVLIGIPLGAGQGWDLSALAALLATGIGLAYIALSLVDWAVQRRALASNPLPDDLDLSDRAVAGEQLAALKGCTPLHRHIRRLLAAWAAGASGPQVAAMAGNQCHRMLGMLAAETAAVWALLACTANFIPPQVLLTLGTGLMALLVVVAIARFQLASHFAGYIESHLLARIGNDTHAAAAADFAQAAGKAAAESMNALAAAQAKFVEQLAKTQEQASALAAKAQQDAAAQIAKAQAEASAQVAKSQADMSAKLTAALDQSSAKIGAAQTEVATQLGRVTALASSIDNVLKLQQAVDGTLKGVAVTDEFKSTLVELRRHLAESDQLLKNAAKPRTIRLVEKDNE